MWEGRKQASGFLGAKKFPIETATEESARKRSKWVPERQEIQHRNPKPASKSKEPRNSTPLKAQASAG